MMYSVPQEADAAYLRRVLIMLIVLTFATGGVAAHTIFRAGQTEAGLHGKQHAGIWERARDRRN